MPDKSVVPDNQAYEFDIVIEINSQLKPELQSDAPSKNLNLCVVIDRSGSMGGEKIETAKACCSDIVKRLSSKDLFSLAIFDNEAEVVVNPATPREEVDNKIKAITTRGNTNLALGWRLGLLELQTFKTEEHINRLILLSDGEANAGETRAGILGLESSKARDLGITTSTIGIGSQFQEDILAAIAFESGGRFHAVRDTQIDDIINAEFKGSLATRIERPSIAFELPKDVEVIEELNNLKKSSGRYKIRPILDNDIFNFAVRLRVDSPAFSEKSFSLKATLYDGEGVVEEVEETIFLVPEAEFAMTEASMVVASVSIP